jgi:hypothetical protein
MRTGCDIKKTANNFKEELKQFSFDFIKIHMSQHMLHQTKIQRFLNNQYI